MNYSYGQETVAVRRRVIYWFRSGVFNLLSSRVNLHLSYNPAGRSHCRLQNHQWYIKHHHSGMGDSLGDVGEATEGLYNELWRWWRDATEGLENELWHRWSDVGVGEWGSAYVTTLSLLHLGHLASPPCFFATFVIGDVRYFTNCDFSLIPKSHK